MILTLLLSGCKGNGDKTPTSGQVSAATNISPQAPRPTFTSAEPPAEDETITVLFATMGWKLPRYEKLIDEFETVNPNLRVQLVSMDEFMGPAQPASGDGGEDDSPFPLASAADVIEMPTYPKLARLGLMQDLAPFIQADPTFETEDFYPGALEYFQWQGGVWSLPTALNFEMIFFDKDAFDEAGEPYPEPGWTWDDFDDKARALTAREGETVTRWGFVPLNLRYYDLVQARAGSLLDKHTDPLTARFDHPEVIAAVRWYVDLQRDQIIPFIELPEPDEMGRYFTTERQTLIDTGKAAMWNMEASTWQWSQERGNIGVVPFPVESPDSHTTHFYASGLSMSAGTAHPDAAWRWMHFLTRQSQAGGTFGALPARHSVVEASGVWDEMDQELAAALRYAVDHSYAPVAIDNDAFSQALKAVFEGEKSVEQALAEAQALAQADIQAEFARQTAATPVPAPIVASSQEDKILSESSVHIAFAPNTTSPDLQWYRNAAQQFHEIHPDIGVEVKPPSYSGDYDLQHVAQKADCFRWTSFQDPKLQAVVLSLEPFINADTSFDINDFFTLPLDEFSRQGQLWGLPAEMQLSVIAYNKDLFDRAGVAYPTADWTMDDFLTMAVALTQGEGADKQYGFVGEVYEANDLMLALERLGAKLFDKSVTPPAAAFDDPDTVEALNWFTNLSTLYGVKPIFIADYNQTVEVSVFMEREALIIEEKAAMWTYTGSGQELDTLNVGFVPWPAQGSNSLGWSSGYFISAESENPQACWEWIKFLTGQPTMTSGVPARRSVVESNVYREQVGAELATVYLNSIADAETWSIFQEIVQQHTWLSFTTVWLNQAYGRLLKGEASVQEALADAQELADTYQACIVTYDAFSDPSGWQVCQQKVDPDIVSESSQE